MSFAGNPRRVGIGNRDSVHTNRRVLFYFLVLNSELRTGGCACAAAFANVPAATGTGRSVLRSDFDGSPNLSLGLCFVVVHSDDSRESVYVLAEIERECVYVLVEREGWGFEPNCRCAASRCWSRLGLTGSWIQSADVRVQTRHDSPADIGGPGWPNPFAY